MSMYFVGIPLIALKGAKTKGSAENRRNTIGVRKRQPVGS